MASLRLAIQKSGRLSEKSLEIIAECGISFNNSTKRLVAKCSNFPLEILYLRDDDIPGYVADGVADIGIVGENVLLEKEKNVTVVKKLGFSKCRLSLAIPRGEDYNNVHDMEGKYIATSYPNILKNYFKEHGVKADVHEISGSVEIAPAINLADAICDIVSTGSTLIGNGLKEVEVVMRSEALLFSTANLDADKQAILDQLVFRIESVNKARKNKYIVLNAPEQAISTILQILPGMKSPTVTPLAEDNWYSVSSVIAEDQFWEIIEQLKAAGAEGILVMPIEKMIL
ncbi:MAG: ATP phosphoribosyltransferase [Chitinophagales bacterium]